MGDLVKYFCSLSNHDAEVREKPRHLFSNDPAVIDAFIKREDRDGRGVFSAIGLYEPGATTRNSATTKAVPFVVCDCDLKNMVEGRESVLEVLRALALPPNWIHDSGFGLRPGWDLKEPLTTDEDMRRAEVVMQRLVVLLAGDPAPTNRCSLYRAPGSHNTKGGGKRLCQVIEAAGTPYDITELEDMLDLYGQPLLHYAPGKEPKGNKGNGHAPEDARPIDVEAELASIRDGADANRVQTAVITSLIWRATHPDDIAKQVLESTMVAAKQSGLAWDAAVEEREVIDRIKSQYQSLFERDYDPASGVPIWLPMEFHQAWGAALAAGRRPTMTRNGSGWHIRSYGENGKNDDAPKTPEDAPKTPEDAPKKPFVLRPFEPFDPAELPPREFLFGRHYQRRTVSGTVAPGGTGKSSLVMVEYIAMAAGRDLFGDGSLKERVRTWYHNGEDNMLELQRRLAAICQHYNIPMEELRGWFFMTSGVEVPLRVAESYNQVRLQIDHRLVKCITEHIGDNKIAAAGFDPLVTVHGVRESDPGQMDAVVRIFAQIADHGNCSNDLSHHTRKQPPGSNGIDVELDDMRGAKAISDAMRMVRILNPMSIKDAEAAGVDELLRTNYFRIDRGKANYSAPAKTAVWRQFVNVPLPNGDDVGVVSPWQYPGQDGRPSPERAEAERKAEHVFLEALDRFSAAGRRVGESGPRNAPFMFAKEREAKLAKVGKAALDGAMRRLFERGVIGLEEYTTGHRHTAFHIVRKVR